MKRLGQRKFASAAVATSSAATSAATIASATFVDSATSTASDGSVVACADVYEKVVDKTGI